MTTGLFYRGGAINMFPILHSRPDDVAPVLRLS
jgi:hypothetical protein